MRALVIVQALALVGTLHRGGCLVPSPVCVCAAESQLDPTMNPQTHYRASELRTAALNPYSSTAVTRDGSCSEAERNQGCVSDVGVSSPGGPLAPPELPA